MRRETVPCLVSSALFFNPLCASVLQGNMDELTRPQFLRAQQGNSDFGQ